MAWKIKQPETYRLAVPSVAVDSDGDEYQVLPDGASGVSVEIVAIGRKRIAELAKAAREAASHDVVVEEVKDGAVTRRVPERQVDDDEASAEAAFSILAEGLRAWTGIEDADGAPVPCTADMQRAIFSDAPGFARWCMSVVVGQADAAAQREEEEAAAEAGFRGNGHPPLAAVSRVASGV